MWTERSVAKLRQFLDVSLPRRGYRTQPRVSTLGTVSPQRRALKGLQIARVMHRSVAP
jgi:hypothetical protein